MRLTKPTNGFLCSLSDNVHNIEFDSFIVKDDDSKKILFQVEREDMIVADTVQNY